VSAYYNEFDPFAAQWLRNLVAAGHIAPGDVDERSIVDVRADDLRDYSQCHFFAGIGGWSYALRLAGWDDARPVWTGSCPCQPFSAAGQGKAADDERHLWPAWASLIAECRPGTVFGEQVEAAIGWGWLDAVFADLEAEGYGCGASVLPACSVGAPHIRNRVWYLGELGDPSLARLEGQPRNGGNGRQPGWLDAQPPRPVAAAGSVGELADAEQWGRQGGGYRSAASPAIIPSAHCWSDLIWLPCRDGKARPTQPGLQPLAHGSTARVGRLRAYGNAIVPQVAAEFVRAFMEGQP
jgi:DNA (cytosine-5)-methyltransferase 1